MTEAMRLYTLDADCLERAKRGLQQPHSPLLPAFERLLEDARSQSLRPLESVMAKTLLPASGDAHDYYSFGTYWWPNPHGVDGLPYVRRDGHTNPHSQSDATDTRRIERMCERCLTQGLAYYFTDETRYARAAAEQIRCWFLTAETRMNPHLEYGQAIPGVVSGRGTGLIDTRLLWMVIDTIGMITPAEQLSAPEVAELQAWFRSFNRWMFDSEVGHAEYVWHNNHGTWYDVQRAVNALFCGDTGLVATIIEQGITQRLAAQIAQDGRQYMELERPIPFHYCAFNLEAHLLLCRYAEHVGIDRWRRIQDGRCVQQGIDYLLPFIADPSGWPYPDLCGIEYDSALRLLLQAARGYPQQQARYLTVLATLPSETLTQRDRLMWPC